MIASFPAALKRAKELEEAEAKEAAAKIAREAAKNERKRQKKERQKVKKKAGKPAPSPTQTVPAAKSDSEDYDAPEVDDEPIVLPSGRASRAAASTGLISTHPHTHASTRASLSLSLSLSLSPGQSLFRAHLQI